MATSPQPRRPFISNLTSEMSATPSPDFPPTDPPSDQSEPTDIPDSTDTSSSTTPTPDPPQDYGPHAALAHPHLLDNHPPPQFQSQSQPQPPTPPPASPSCPSTPYTTHPPIDYDGLSWPSLGTKLRLTRTPTEQAATLLKMQSAIHTILLCLGEDPTRAGLLGTPERYARSLLHFTRGYELNLRSVLNNALFTEDHDELIIVRDIPIFSLCEHHLVPFSGTMHIGYIPNKTVVGLSKLARIADMFASRLQVQERLTKQVALAVTEILKPQGVAVVVEASHLCMVMRGVGKTTARTTTSCMLGAFRQRARTREEFLDLIRNPR